MMHPGYWGKIGCYNFFLTRTSWCYADTEQYGTDAVEIYPFMLTFAH